MGLQNCCCGSLKTGGLIIGWLGVISAISGLCFYVPSLAYLNQSSDELFHKMVAENQQVTHEQVVAGVRFITLNAIASNIVNLLIDGSLLYGTYKNDKMFLLPWLIWTMIGIVFFGIFSLLIILYTVLFGGVTFGVLVFFVLAIVFGLSLYFWLCILSLYSQINLNVNPFNQQAPDVQNLPDRRQYYIENSNIEMESLTERAPPPYDFQTPYECKYYSKSEMAPIRG